MRESIIMHEFKNVFKCKICNNYFSFIALRGNICPKCGNGDFENVIGRWIEKKKYLFGIFPIKSEWRFSEGKINCKCTIGASTKKVSRDLPQLLEPYETDVVPPPPPLKLDNNARALEEMKKDRIIDPVNEMLKRFDSLCEPPINIGCIDNMSVPLKSSILRLMTPEQFENNFFAL